MKKSLRRLLTLSCLASLTLAATPLAQASGLGLESSLNLLSFGNFSAPSSDVQGRVAIGGNADFTGYSIDTLNGWNTLYSGTGLTVGGNLVVGGGSFGGNTVVGGNLSTVAGMGASFLGNLQVAGNLNANTGLTAAGISYGGSLTGNLAASQPAGQVAAGSIQTGFNFAAEQQRLSSLAQNLDAATTTASGYRPYSSLLTFDTQGANLAVFDLSASDVASGGLQLDNLGANTTVVLNVHGQSVNFGTTWYQNFASGRVLFNLPEATQVTFGGYVDASFLAPLAKFSTSWGAINGQVVVGSWSGAVQVNDAAFVGNISAVPEPETYAMLLAGLGLMGFTVQRRRKLTVSA
ncbi:MAG: collagen-binding domain-containing protein [Rhodoferax sp.]